MARSGKHLPDDWRDELFVCPDPACGKLQRAGLSKGNPPCKQPIHHRTGKFPPMDKVEVGITGRPS